MNRNLLAGATCVAMLVSMYLIFMYAPTEVTMGDVQRIFYFHFASHWVNFLAIFCVFIYSVRFLIQTQNANSTSRPSLPPKWAWSSPPSAHSPACFGPSRSGASGGPGMHD